MIPIGPPPAPPACVVFDENVGPETKGTLSRHLLNFVAASLADTTQVQVTGDTAITMQLDCKGHAELRAIHTSLNKKARVERMGDFEREYPW